MTPQSDPPIDQLIDTYLDRGPAALSADQRETLDRLVATDPAVTDLFARRTLVHSLMHQRTQAVPAAVVSPASPEAVAREGATAPPRLSRFEIPNSYVYAAAALVAIATVVVALYVFSVSSPPSPIPSDAASLATLIESSPGSNLTTPSGFIAEGRDYPRGEYSLDTGTAEFMLTNAVNVKLRGQTRMSMHNDMHVSLAYGSAAFVVPKNAKGFTVHLPDKSKIVDLGTAFHVAVDDENVTRLRVVSGSVQWIGAHGDSEPATLAAGQVANIVDGRIRVDPTARTFTAYHDFGRDLTDGITTHMTGDESVELIDHTMWARTSIRLSIEGHAGLSNSVNETKAPVPDTPADLLMSGSGIDLNRGLLVIGDHYNKGRPFRLRFTGLDPNLRYDLAMYGNRTPSRGIAPSRFSLIGAEAAVNRSTKGVIDRFATELDTRENGKTGHVVRWTEIAAGADGTILVEIATTHKGRNNMAYINAIRLVATDVPSDTTNANPSPPDVPAGRSLDSEPADR